MSWLGLDIGGANIKASDGRDFALTTPFALWRDPAGLAHQNRQVIAESPKCDHLVATMTGELADCFESKAAGVAHIVAALEEAAAGRHLRFYRSDGRLVTSAVATRQPEWIAAANWHALARFAAQFAPQGRGILVDVGSTTTDILPLAPEALEQVGKTDTQRMQQRHLLYTGVIRSPICAVVDQLPYRGGQIRPAQELFATTRDVYLLQGDLPEDAADRDTADGQPATKSCARRRLGRMICADESEFHHRDAAIIAQHVADCQAAMITDDVDAMVDVESMPTAIVSGKGEFLAKRAIERSSFSGDVLHLGHELGVANLSVAATACALVSIAQQPN